MHQQSATLQQGVWIDQQRLAEAGLDDPFEITVYPGEIRIRSGQTHDESRFPTAASVDQHAGTEAGWKAFRSLADDAESGRLANPSVHHDRYLYGDSP